MVNTEIRLIIFFAVKDGEALYSQQKQDQELTVAHIMNSLLQKWSEVAQLCLTLCDYINGSLPGSTIHGIFQARVLEWDAIAFSDIHTTIHKIDNQQGPTVEHRELNIL